MWVEKYGGSINGQLRRLGSSLDWTRSVRPTALRLHYCQPRIAWENPQPHHSGCEDAQFCWSRLHPSPKSHSPAPARQQYHTASARL